MKNINFISGLIFFLVFSCNTKNNYISDANNVTSIAKNDTLSDKYEVLNDFLNRKIRDKSKKIVIFREKININTTLKWLLHNDIHAVDPINLEVKDKDWGFFRVIEWEIARGKYSKNVSVLDIKNKTHSTGTCCWSAKNFNYQNLILEESKIGSTDYIKKYLLQKEDYEYYSFSEPIFYQSNTYLVFSFTHGSVRTIISHSSNLVIYKKQNGKWILSHIGNPDFVS